MPQLCSKAFVPRHLRNANVRLVRPSVLGALHPTRPQSPPRASPRSPNVPIPISPKAPLHSQPRPSRTSRSRHSPLASSRSNGQAPEPFTVTASQRLFSDSFKQALNEALERSTESSGEVASIVDRTTLGVPSLSVPKLPPRPSAQEDMLGAALEASRTSLSRLMAIRNEVERAIEREKLQVERLEFAADKAQKDEAYYRVLRMIQERGASDME